MKKTIAFLITAVMLIGLLAGCGSAAQSGTPAPQNSSAPASAAPASSAPSEQPKVEYPTKPVEIIVANAAGGGNDIAARVLAEYLEKNLGQRFVVSNKDGGGSTVGLAELAAAKPDGYTLGIYTNTTQRHQWTTDGVPYTVDSFTPVLTMTTDATVLVVNKNLGINTMDEFIAYAKEKKMTFGGPSTGNQYFAMVALQDALGVTFEQMAFSGGSDSITAVAGGNCDATACFPAEVIPMLEAGHIVALGYMDDIRNPNLPDLPTLPEQGIDAKSTQLRWLCAPAGTSEEILSVLSDAFAKIAEDPDYISAMETAGFTLRSLERPASVELYNSEAESIRAFYEG